MNEIYIVSALRTPVGSFLGGLATLSASDLAAAVIKASLEKIQLESSSVDEVFLGNVLQAGVGQAPARQAALKAGLPNDIPCTTINKVCASGMKSVMIAAQTILCGDNHVVIAGGMENMSQTPHYVNGRSGTKFGNIALVDGITKDGLLDVYSNLPMGNCAELCAKEYAITREEQDDFALDSYKKSAEAWKSGLFNNEVISISIPQKKGEPNIISEDEEFKLGA
jgi:acetyl-CoA C-acetyltransferase